MNESFMDGVRELGNYRMLIAIGLPVFGSLLALAATVLVPRGKAKGFFTGAYMLLASLGAACLVSAWDHADGDHGHLLAGDHSRVPAVRSAQAGGGAVPPRLGHFFAALRPLLAKRSGALAGGLGAALERGTRFSARSRFALAAKAGLRLPTWLSGRPLAWSGIRARRARTKRAFTLFAAEGALGCATRFSIK